VVEFVMPILGADMSAGTLRAWHKQPGDAVKRGDIIAEVETDKGLIDVEVFTAGVIDKLLVGVGETVPVGTVLAAIREEGAPAADTTAQKPPMAPTAAPAVPTPLPVAVAAIGPPVEPTRARVSPLARKRAEALGVDLASLHGTGPSGAITREDVERAAARAPGAGRPAPAAAVFAPERMRQTIGAAMARSKREIPHYYLGTTVDMHRAVAWLSEENLGRAVPDRLLAGVLLIKAVALALREVPELNGFWKDGKAVPSPAIHVGTAIALRGGGLVAPALHDTDRSSLDELMRKLRDLVKRARAGGLRSSELSDPTITVTSLGDQGVETVFGIVYPPQVAIVGFGTLVERPWCVHGQVVARPVITVTLAADHRVTDGHRGARFLAAVDRLLQEPAQL
jgi:pyruvate dehydrogenase E2 component (dihydrolipoamide acetyltransferase)